jgi:hypothetical protein
MVQERGVLQQAQDLLSKLGVPSAALVPSPGELLGDEEEEGQEDGEEEGEQVSTTGAGAATQSGAPARQSPQSSSSAAKQI